jgi:hypothetical protein
MANMIQDGISWLAGQLKTHASNQVIYKRGTNTVTVNATLGKTEFEVEHDSGVVDRVETRDYLINAADIDFGAGPVKPQRGDKIVEVLNGTTHTRTVSVPTQGQVWSHDGFEVKLRVHTWERQ